VVVVVAGGIGGYRLYDWVQHDNSFCRSCHIMETAWTKWEVSEHSKVSCHSCHSVSPVIGGLMVVQYLVQRPERTAAHAAVPDKACEKCHSSNDPRWRQVAQTAGHKVHAEEQNLACQKCHGLRLHVFRPSSELCAACHPEHTASQEKAIKIESMRDMHCLECHNFLRESSPLRPTRDTCLVCHQSLPVKNDVVFPDNSPMLWDCKECHKPHDSAKPTVDCTSCHADAMKAGTHATTKDVESKCITCHRPHDWKPRGKTA
jgi:hypothetical protein